MVKWIDFVGSEPSIVHAMYIYRGLMMISDDDDDDDGDDAAHVADAAVGAGPQAHHTTLGGGGGVDGLEREPHGDTTTAGRGRITPQKGDSREGRGEPQNSGFDGVLTTGWGGRGGGRTGMLYMKCVRVCVCILF